MGGRMRRSEIKETSQEAKAGVKGRSAGVIRRALKPSRHQTRGSSLSFWWN